MLSGLREGENATTGLLHDLAHNWRDGRIKLYLIWKTLQFRRQNAALFSRGSFLQVECTGKRQEHLAAFVRRDKKQSVLIVVPRWLARANYSANSKDPERFWGDTDVRFQKSAPVSWKNILTGETIEAKTAGSRRSIPVGKLLKTFPVALLTGDSGSARTPSDLRS
jgi:(1->4)-alpha-D-glucan 1-alpha-D-glucosylmutase